MDRLIVIVLVTAVCVNADFAQKQASTGPQSFHRLEGGTVASPNQGHDRAIETFSKLRELLKVPPSAQFKEMLSRSLPDANPLKICLAPIENTAVRDALVEWVIKWNKDKGKKYGILTVGSR